MKTKNANTAAKRNAKATPTETKVTAAAAPVAPAVKAPVAPEAKALAAPMIKATAAPVIKAPAAPQPAPTIAPRVENRPVVAPKAAPQTTSPVVAQVQARPVAAPKAAPQASARREITNELIAARAYTIWEQQGRPQGRERDNWLLAESQLKQEIQSFTA